MEALKDCQCAKEMVKLCSSEGDTFQVAKDILCQESEYFRGLFSSGMKESSQTSVKLPTFSTALLTHVVKYFVKERRARGKPLKWSLQESIIILEAANYLQISGLIDLCIKNISSKLTADACWEVRELAKRLYLPDLEEGVRKWLAANIASVKDTDEFKALGITEFVSLLQRDDVKVDSEFEVFDIALDFCQRHKDEVKDPKVLFSCIRYALMSVEELKRCETLMKPVGVHGAYEEMLQDLYLCEEDPFHIHRLPYSIQKPRCTEKYIVATGGFTSRENTSNRMQFLKLQDLMVEDKANGSHGNKTMEAPPVRTSGRTRRQQTETSVVSNKIDVTENQEENNAELQFTSVHSRGYNMPDPLCEHCVAKLGNYVYIAGGQTKYHEDGRYTVDIVHQLDLVNWTWKEVCPMLTSRSLFYLGNLGGHLYAVGGWRAPNCVTLSVERYCPAKDHWDYVSPLDVNLHEHAGCAHNEKLYVSGGYKGPNRGHLSQMREYDPSNNTWTEKSTMIRGRSYHAMVSWEDKLIVAGGVSYRGHDSFEDVLMCESYNPEANQWTELTRLPMYASCMGHLLVDRFLFLFGGHSFASDNEHTELQILNLKNNSWKTRKFAARGIKYFALIICDIQSKHIS